MDRSTDRWDDATARAALLRLFEAGVRAADPLAVLAPHLPPPPTTGRVVVVGVGKAAAKMALAVEQAWPHVPLTSSGHADVTKPLLSASAALQNVWGKNAAGIASLTFQQPFRIAMHASRLIGKSEA